MIALRVRDLLAVALLAALVLLFAAAPAQAKFGFVTKWGSFGDGNGQFAFPRGVATDAAGNVYVADADLERVQKFTSNGTFITTWGSEGFAGNGRFESPESVATDAADNVYVADTDNQRIQKFTSNGTFITQWGSVGDGNGQFAFPRGVATDAAGNVYVADQVNARIQKFTSNGTFITKWGSFGDANGQFNNPFGVSTDAAGSVYVADLNDRIQKFTSNGTFITKWGTEGSGNGQFDNPEDLATDAAGNVYVADDGNDRIQKFGRVPVTRITRGPKGKTRKRSAAFRFRSDEPGSTFACRLGKRKWKPCSSPVRYRKLKPGKHVFRVRGTVIGNRGTAAKRKWQVKPRRNRN